jgi:hypothetical protein
VPLNFIHAPTQEEPTDFPLPEPYSARYTEGAAGDLSGLTVEGRRTGVVSHGALTVTNRTGRTGTGHLSSQVEIHRESVFGTALVDWFEFERMGSPCDVELVIYARDDATEYFVAGNGRFHESPYLCELTGYGETEVDFAKGSSSIGQINLTVLDKRTVRGDQTTGRFTGKLADEFGRPLVIGRRTRVRRFNEGRWIVLIEGVLVDVKMDSSFSAYQLVVRDFRELERKASAFTTGDTSALWPRGVVDGWGKMPDGSWLVPPVQPWKGRFKYESATRGWFDMDSKATEFPASQILTDRMVKALEASWDRDRGKSIIRKVAVMWRAEGTNDPWVEYRNSAVYRYLKYPLFGYKGWRNIGLVEAATDTSYEGRKIGKILNIRLDDPQMRGGGPLVWPADEQRVEVILRYVGPPSEDFPFHWEGTVGQLLEQLYEGLHSDSLRFHQPYALESFQGMDTPVRLRLTKPIKDVRKWLEENVWQALGAAPAWNDEGAIYPVYSNLPENITGLPEITDAMVMPEAGWQLLGSRAVNVVNFHYGRAVRVEVEDDPFSEAAAGDNVYVHPVELEYRSEDGIFDLEEKEITIKTEVFTALGTPEAEPLTTVEDETGWQLSMERQLGILSRFRFGAQLGSALCRRSLTHALRVGDWVINRLSWQPNFFTGRRGNYAIGQIVSIKETSCTTRDLQVEHIVAYVDEEGNIIRPDPVEVEPWDPAAGGGDDDL